MSTPSFRGSDHPIRGGVQGLTRYSRDRPEARLLQPGIQLISEVVRWACSRGSINLKRLLPTSGIHMVKVIRPRMFQRLE